MSKSREVTKDISMRIIRADEVISSWMKEENITEARPEDCMEVLVASGIYEYDRHGRAHNFREDLRTSRDCNKLDMFSKLVIEQTVPRAPWYIKLK